MEKIKETAEDELWYELYHLLDEKARERDHYDFGLPMTNTEEIINELKSKFKLTKI